MTFDEIRKLKQGDKVRHIASGDIYTFEGVYAIGFKLKCEKSNTIVPFKSPHSKYFEKVDIDSNANTVSISKSDHFSDALAYVDFSNFDWAESSTVKNQAFDCDCGVESTEGAVDISFHSDWCSLRKKA